MSLKNNNKNYKGLYIHIPFCRQKCLYCDFPSYAGKEELIYSYVDALVKEIQYYNEESFNTIFIGGGTPTYLPLEALMILCKSVNKLNIAADSEFTIECNPGTVDENKLRYLKSSGINRLSIGLQAWQNRLLKNLGRIHSQEEFLKSYEIARKAGFDNINIDIMFGLPGQSLSDLMETLKSVTSLAPEHLSCYSLIIEEGTPFGDRYKRGNLKLPDEDETTIMYEKAIEYLYSKGYMQYEISNFAKKGFQCRHNLKYWNLDEYIGCGAAAHSYLNHIRYNNKHQIKDYIYAVNKGEKPVNEIHKNTQEDEIEEFVFLGLRKSEGISENEFRDRFGMDINSIYGEIIDKYKKYNLIIKKNGQIFLSLKGIEISNTILSDFILT